MLLVTFYLIAIPTKRTRSQILTAWACCCCSLGKWCNRYL